MNRMGGMTLTDFTYPCLECGSKYSNEELTEEFLERLKKIKKHASADFSCKYNLLDMALK